MPLAEYIKLKSLNLRLRAVNKIRYLTTLKNRKMIVEGIFMSKELGLLFDRLMQIFLQT